MYLNTCEKGKPQKETQGYRGDWGGSCVESRRAEPGPQRPGDGEPLVLGAGLWQLLLGGCPCWVHLSPLLSAAASACTALSLRHYPDDEGSLSSYPSPVCSRYPPPTPPTPAQFRLLLLMPVEVASRLTDSLNFFAAKPRCCGSVRTPEAFPASFWFLGTRGGGGPSHRGIKHVEG